MPWFLRFFLERGADRVNYPGKSIPDSCQLAPYEMIPVPAGGWHCSGGLCFCAGDGDGETTDVLGGCSGLRNHSPMLRPRGLEGSPGHPLSSVALETESVLSAKSCCGSLVKDPCNQYILKPINLTFPGNCAEEEVTDL